MGPAVPATAARMPTPAHPVNRGDAGFAFPELYEFLEDEAYQYAIRLKGNPVLERQIEQPLIRPPIRAAVFLLEKRCFCNKRYTLISLFVSGKWPCWPSGAISR